MNGPIARSPPVALLIRISYGASAASASANAAPSRTCPGETQPWSVSSQHVTGTDLIGVGRLHRTGTAGCPPAALPAQPSLALWRRPPPPRRRPRVDDRPPARCHWSRRIPRPSCLRGYTSYTLCPCLCLSTPSLQTPLRRAVQPTAYTRRAARTRGLRVPRKPISQMFHSMIRRCTEM